MRRLLMTAIRLLLLGRRCNGFGLNHRQRWLGWGCWLGWASIEVGNRAGCFRNRCRPEFVRDRSGQTVLRAAPPGASRAVSSRNRCRPGSFRDRSGQTVPRAATPAASATTSATAGPPLAACRLIGASHSGLLVGFVLLGFTFVAGEA